MNRRAVLSVALLAGFVTVAALATAARTGLDSYPPYSSLRTDPLGTSLFFDGLERAGVHVIRRYDPTQLESRRASDLTCFYVAPNLIAPDTAQALYAFVLAGGRLVWLQPAPAPPSPLLQALQAKLKRQAPTAWTPPDLWRLLGLSPHAYAHHTRTVVTAAPPAMGTKAPAAPTVWPLDPRGLGLPPLPLASDGYLEPRAPGWIPVYQASGHAVMVTRGLGRGSIVVASDADFATNGEVRSAPNPQLMLWLVGGRPAVRVDETAHGLISSFGLAWLFRRYHLEAGLLALLILLGLAVWRWAPALLPPANGGNTDPLAIEDLRQGYIRLLQRAIPPRRLLAFCLREAGREEPAPPAAAPERIVAAFNALTRERRAGPPRRAGMFAAPQRDAHPQEARRPPPRGPENHNDA